MRRFVPLLLAVLLACGAPALAGGHAPAKPRALDLSIPPGPPPSDQLAEVERLDRGFTLNAEVLDRYGFTLSQYQDMASDEQQRVFDWVRVLERERLLQAARPGGASAPPEPLGAGWSAEQRQAFQRLRDGAQAPERLFDGGSAARGAGEPGGPALTPRLELFGASQPASDGTPDAPALRRLSLTTKNGATLEYGNLGLDGRSPLVAPSPYFSVSKQGGSGAGAVDYDYKWRLNAVDLGARLYTDDNPALDARLDSGINSLGSLDPQWGISPADAAALRQNLSFSHDFEQQWLPVASAMGRVGRAWSLLPHLEAGCSAMGLMRATGIFPNASLDQTCGARVGLSPTSNLGLFGGVTEGLGLFNKTAIADSLAADQAQVRPHVDVAPHAEAVLWGKLPYLSNAEYTIEGGRQFNPWTTVTSLGASLQGPVGDMKAGVFGKYSDEASSPEMEYERQKSAAGLTLTPKPGVDLWAQYQQEHAQYGSAQMDSRGVLLGLTLTDTDGGSKGARVTMDALFGGQEALLSTEQREQFLDLLQQDLALLQQLKDAGLAFTGGPGGAWQSVQDAYDSLDDQTRALLQEAWQAAAPGAPPLAEVMRIKPADFSTLNKLVDLLSDTDAMERLLVRAVRHQILLALKTVDIPVLGHNVHMSAPMVLAAANAYELSLSPIPPITQEDARNALDPWLLGKLSAAAGCASGPQPQATTDCILKGLPQSVQDQLKSQFGGDVNALLKAAVAWPSDVLRREMDREVLQVILAAETLDALTVDQGEKIADLNVQGMMRSFQNLDERRRRETKAVLQAAARSVSADVSREDQAMRQELSDYGRARLAWLKSQAAWPSNVQVVVRPEDWAPLLAVYGDAKLFDLILRAKGQMALSHPSGPARLLIGFSRDGGPLNGVTIVRGNPAELLLPPRPVDLSALDLSFNR